MPSSASVAAPDRAPTPLERQSVMRTLRTPRWLRTEVLAGLVVALALIPEAIAFSIIAGVDPRVGLFASFTMAVTTAIVGGRPAMISAATGAVALVVAPLSQRTGWGTSWPRSSSAASSRSCSACSAWPGSCGSSRDR